MAQSLSQIYLHIIFSTKGRAPYLSSESHRDALWRYITGIFAERESHAITIGGVADHVHVLCTLARTITVADLVKEVKRSSSQWVKTNVDGLHEFGWQSGYGAFSVSHSHLERVTRYIAAQEEHHKKISFQDEFRAIMRKYEVKWDERYIWD